MKTPTHYQKDPTPLDVIEAWNLDFLEGNILKYLARWRDKGGVDDLEKLAHYAQELLCRETTKEQIQEIVGDVSPSPEIRRHQEVYANGYVWHWSSAGVSIEWRPFEDKWVVWCDSKRAEAKGHFVSAYEQHLPADRERIRAAWAAEGGSLWQVEMAFLEAKERCKNGD